MRILALDYGAKRIGVAWSDPLGMIAQPGEVWERRTLEEDLAHLRALIEERQVSRIVVGLPRNMDGSLGFQAQETLEFCREVEKALGLPTDTWDERLTTRAADEILRQQYRNPRKRKEMRDAVAASLILESYLAARGGTLL